MLESQQFKSRIDRSDNQTILSNVYSNQSNFIYTNPNISLVDRQVTIVEQQAKVIGANMKQNTNNDNVNIVKKPK